MAHLNVASLARHFQVLDNASARARPDPLAQVVAAVLSSDALLSQAEK